MPNLPRWQAHIVDNSGNVQASASVEVRDENTGNLVNIFSDRAGTTPLANPFTADSSGYAFFHAAVGTYQITATLGANTRVWRYIDLFQSGTIRFAVDSDPFVLYVRGNTGNDGNSGRVDSSLGAFKTIQRATNLLMKSYDLLGAQQVRIKITEAANYPEVLNLGSYVGRGQAGHTGPIVIEGLAANPTGVVLNPAAAGGAAIIAVETAYHEWIFKNLKLAPTNGHGVISDSGAWVTLLDGITTAVQAGFSHYLAENDGVIEFASEGGSPPPGCNIIPSSGTEGGAHLFNGSSGGRFYFATDFPVEFYVPSNITFSGAVTQLVRGCKWVGVPVFATADRNRMTGLPFEIDSSCDLELQNLAPETVFPGISSLTGRARINFPLGIGMTQPVLVDFNSVVDTQIAMGIPAERHRYMIEKVVISGLLANTITTAQAALYTGAAASGQVICSPQVISIGSIAENANTNTFSMTINNPNTESYNQDPLFFRVTTAQGAQRLALVTIFYRIIS